MQCRAISHKEELETCLPLLANAEAVAVSISSGRADGQCGHAEAVRLAADDLPEIVINCVSLSPSGLGLLQKIFALPAVKVFADATKELPLLLALGINPPSPLFDVTLVSRLLGIAAMREDTGTLPEEWPEEWIVPYEGTGQLSQFRSRLAARDSDNTRALLRMRKALIPLIVQNGMTKVTDIELRCISAVAHMHARGIHLDLSKWQCLTEATRKEQTAALRALTP